MINSPNGLIGQNGLFYDYVMSRQGIYVQAENDRITARVLHLPGYIRGLSDTSEKLVLNQGKIPVGIVNLGISWMMINPRQERLFSIVISEGKYKLEIPAEQQGDAASLRYARDSDDPIVAQFHSHCDHRAFFSYTDDQDEQGFAIYGVAGRLTLPEPELALRIGIYGHFGTVRWPDVFDHKPKAKILDQ